MSRDSTQAATATVHAASTSTAGTPPYPASSSSSSAPTERVTPARQGSGDVLSYYFHTYDPSDPQAPAAALSRASSARTMGSIQLPDTPEEVEEGGAETEHTPRARRQMSGEKHMHPAGSVSPVTSSGTGTPNGTSSADSGETKVHRRRSSKTANASDKRRLAIVEVEGNGTSGTQAQDDSRDAGTPPSLLARRGMDTSRLALVAPPDASPLTYTDLSPAPPVSAPPVPRPEQARATEPQHSTHTRSRSNFEGTIPASSSRRSTSSRDIGIVGAVRSPGRTPTRDDYPHRTSQAAAPTVPTVPEVGLGLPPNSAGEDTAVAPIFQTPSTRTPSPDAGSDPASSREALPPHAIPPVVWAQQHLAGRMITPEIGESKELGTAVAPPVVTLLSGVSPQLTAPSVFPGPIAYAASSGSSPGSDYSLAASPGSTYYALATPPQAYPYRLPGSHINYDPVLHATAGPLPEPPRMRDLGGSNLAPPPPRPPRVSRSRSPLKDVTTSDPPKPAPPPAPSSPPPQLPELSALGASVTPKAGQSAFMPPMPNPLVRSMSDYSITAVSATSDSEYEPASGSTPPTSDLGPAQGPAKSGRSPSVERAERHTSASSATSTSHPPSAFRRNSRSSRQHTSAPRSPDSAESSSRQTSPTALSPTKSREEKELEEMLASMAPALVGAFERPPSPEQRASKGKTPTEATPRGKSEQHSSPSVAQSEAEIPRTSGTERPAAVSTTVDREFAETSSPPFPALPVDTPVALVEAEQIEAPVPQPTVISLNQSPPEPPSPVKSGDTDKYDSASSYESYVHASRPTTPISETTASPGNKHSRRPSLTLAFTPKGSRGSNETRSISGPERSPSLSSQFGRLAGAAKHRAAERQIRSPWNAARGTPAQKAKAIAAWPAAMRFDDVLRLKSPLERAQGYARKINELAQVESGLTNWIIAVKSGPAATPDSFSKLRTPTATYGFATGNRKVSAGSHTSDASFPTRPDATIATQIPSNDDDSPPIGAPANLPYPALAQGIGQRSQSTRSYNSSLSVSTTPSRSISSGPLSASKKAGNFFSSIGRKNSTRRERNLPLPNSNPLSRQTSSPLSPGGISGSESSTRLMRPGVAPSIPGGPREPPSRLQKATPVSRRSSLDSPVAVSPPLPTNALDKRRSVGHAALGQYARSNDAPRGARAYGALDETSPQFSASLQKMADILPQASRGVLARYLTEANGEEMLAITRYIEDERSGGVQY